MTEPPDLFPFLALCARAQGTPAQYELLRERAATLPSWEGVPFQAEAHGLEPLLYAHLQAAGISIPPHVEQQLQMRTMQHAHANHVRSKMLAQILGAFQSAGIQALVLKGAALAHLVYPRPELRVMRDVDLLVRAPEADRAQSLLLELGFHPPTYDLPADHAHLPAVKKVVEGLPVSVEMHRQLFSADTHLGVITYDDLAPLAQSFGLYGATAYTLGREDMLWHVYAHAFATPLTYEPLRLVWAADLVSLVEAWVDVMDWDTVQRRYRRAFNALPMLHHLTPWSDGVLERLSLDVPRVPGGTGQVFQGWPRFSLAAQREKGYWGILRDSFYPPEWWLRMHYGVGSNPASLWWMRLVRHPLHILGWMGDYLTRRINIKREKA